jgi:hypothetical protein
VHREGEVKGRQWGRIGGGGLHAAMVGPAQQKKNQYLFVLSINIIDE